MIMVHFTYYESPQSKETTVIYVNPISITTIDSVNGVKDNFGLKLTFTNNHSQTYWFRTATDREHALTKLRGGFAIALADPRDDMAKALQRSGPNDRGYPAGPMSGPMTYDELYDIENRLNSTTLYIDKHAALRRLLAECWRLNNKLIFGDKQSPASPDSGPIPCPGNINLASRIRDEIIRLRIEATRDLDIHSTTLREGKIYALNWVLNEIEQTNKK